MTDIDEVVSSAPDEVLEKARAAMAREGFDAVVLTSPENVAYASGASPPSQRTVRARIAACVLPYEGETELIAIKLEGGIVGKQSRLDRLTLYEEFVEHPVAVIAASLRERGLARARIGIEETHLTIADRRVLEEELPHADIQPVDELAERLRMIKTPREIELIRMIGGVAQQVAREAVAVAAPGMTERELAQHMTERYVELGGDALTMLVVGSGPRSGEVNAPPTSRALQRGDMVRLDVIGTADHYYSDVARTAVVGEPTDEEQRVYDLLDEVHRSVLGSLAPGVRTNDVYATYRSAMEEAGLPPYHFVGHGLGVSLHEEPFCNDLNSTALEPGMVLCIEPLVLMAGRFGIQLEDEVLITPTGCELLTENTELLKIGG